LNPIRELPTRIKSTYLKVGQRRFRKNSTRRLPEERKGRKRKMKIVLDKSKNAIMPTRAHKNDAGLDLYTPRDIVINGGCSGEIDTGVHVQIPKGWYGDVRSKSGLLFKHDVATDGTVDEDYTGSINIKLFNHGHQPIYFQAGDKVAQLVITPCLKPELEVVDELEETERGNNGFGSTGR
jgi:dUTP pyrophosphatase